MDKAVSAKVEAGTARVTAATKKDGISLHGLSNLRQILNRVTSRYTFMTNIATFQTILLKQEHIHP